MKKGFIFSLLAIAGILPSFGASFYSGSDKACFYGGLQTSCTPTSSKSTLGIGIPAPPLSYTPNSGFTAPASGGVVDLGTFAVAYDLAGAADGTFDINVMFTAPAGAGGQTYSASALGLVLFGFGGAEITFNNPTTQLYTYPGGEFDLSLPSDTIFVGAGCSQDLDATITPLTTVPEPTALAATGLALMFLGFVFRSRRVQAQRVKS